MSEKVHHDDHGHTVAAWTAVVIILIGFTIGAAGFIIANAATVYVGAAICVIGAIAGKVLQMMGLGKQPAAAAATSPE